MTGAGGKLDLDLYLRNPSKETLLIVPIPEDERPLKGVTGLLDWRLCGMLSRLIAQGRMTGSEGEFLLIPTRYRQGVRTMLCVGIGGERAPARETAARRMRFADGIHAKVEKLGFRRVLFLDSFRPHGADQSPAKWKEEFAAAFGTMETGWIS